MDILRIILSVIFPPLGVFLQVGIVQQHEAAGCFGFAAAAGVVHAPGTFAFDLRSFVAAQYDGTVRCGLVGTNMC